jgi:hypothetical protein
MSSGEAGGAIYRRGRSSGELSGMAGIRATSPTRGRLAGWPVAGDETGEGRGE